MQFLVNIRQLDGTKKRLLLEAASQDELYETPGLSEAIESIFEIPFGLKLGSTHLSLYDELLLVAQVATLVDSGANIAKGIEEVAQGTPFLRGYLLDPRINHASTISEYLKIFGVSDNVLLLIKSGEKSGRLGEAVNAAAVSVEQAIELKKVTGADLKLGITYLLAGLISILALSLVLGEPAQNIVDIPQFRDNVATHLIIAIHDLQAENTAIFLISLVAIFFCVNYLWQNVPGFKSIWGVKALDDLLKARRSANFLSAWIPLFTSGFSAEKALTIISQNYTGSDKKAVESIVAGVSQGGTIPRSLETAYWSPSFIIGMKAFDAAHDEARRKLLDRIKGMLITEIFVTGKRFSKLTLLIGTVAALITIFLIAMGFYAPMLLARA